MAPRKTPAIQRAASLVLLPALFEELGVPLDEVLADTGVSAEELRPDAFIPYAAYLAILDHAAEIARRDDIGLLLGSRQSLGALGPLGRAMCHAATLGEALGAFTAYQIGNSTGGTVYVRRSDRDVILGYGIYDPSIQVSHHIHDMVLAVGCRIVAELTHGAVEPDEILSSRATPKNRRPYCVLGNSPIRFGQSQTGLVFNADQLSLELPGANSNLHKAALAELTAESDRRTQKHAKPCATRAAPFAAVG